MRYSPPKAADFQRLKNDLGRTGEEMADLFGVAGGQQWRKYTGGAQPREMAPQMLFFGAARLALSDEELERVLARMREIGAAIDLSVEAPADEQD
ncbi:XRE family transcriptional regulator [Cupriavidus pauculus]|uniref:XRE family transcriptional regulator n=1 Tax=Cupriavidus pauculus TaxID=82633 RepID=A0A5P2GZW0_9BURK|nr:XRE family transcriptional regulator [Cupriavidus pauculus]QET01121.1 XRE family transcriptional regulator [Cupriavidus pauculus]